MSEILSIESLDNEARGIARRDGKAIFVEGALPGEVVEANIYRKKPSYENAHTVRVIKPSFMRVEPKCPNYGVCGGCAMQHLEPSAQVAVKQRTLEDNFKHIAGLKIPHVLPPIYGPTWGYRFRARLSVRYVRKKDSVLIGFREKKGHFVVDMTECLVLPQNVSNLLVPMRELIASLTIKEAVPQIEVAVGDECIVLALRHMEPLIAEDVQKLEQFAAQHNVVWWTQTQRFCN